MTRLPISVIIPTYNRAQLVLRAVRNVLAQIEADDEVIVVDDASSDDTASVLAPYLSRIRYLPVPHGGAGRARNHGIQVATRPLIAFLDSDDEWMPDKLLLQRPLMEARPDVLFCFSDFTGWDGKSADQRYLRHWHHDSRPWDAILGPGIPFSSIAPLPAGRPEFQVHLGSMYLAELLSDYIPTPTVLVRRVEAGPALHFAEDLPISEDKECFARLAGAGTAAYFDCDTCWVWAHVGERLTDQANAHILASARLKIMERVWGQDPEFLLRHGAEFARKKVEQHLNKVRWLIVRGRTREAREELAQVGSAAPWGYRFLAALPGTLAWGVLALRRLVLRTG
jgi:glycosyltransferase involved in cell wall biosynthesis